MEYMKNTWVRTVLSVLAAVVLYSKLLIASAPICGQLIKTAAYSVCLPRGWNVLERRNSDSEITACSGKGKCMFTGGGLPTPGHVVMYLIPAANAPGLRDIGSASSLVKDRSWQGTGQLVEEVPVHGYGIKSCWVSRGLLFGKVWNEVYGLEVGPAVLFINVKYNNEIGNVDMNRSVVRNILSSIESRRSASRP